MLRSELIDRLSERFPQLRREDVAISVEEIFTGVSQTLAAGGRVEIRRFGTFELLRKKAMVGRNPATGAAVPMPATCRPHFRPARELRELVDR